MYSCIPGGPDSGRAAPRTAPKQSGAVGAQVSGDWKYVRPNTSMIEARLAPRVSTINQQTTKPQHVPHPCLASVEKRWPRSTLLHDPPRLVSGGAGRSEEPSDSPLAALPPLPAHHHSPWCASEGGTLAPLRCEKSSKRRRLLLLTRPNPAPRGLVGILGRCAVPQRLIDRRQQLGELLTHFRIVRARRRLVS